MTGPSRCPHCSTDLRGEPIDDKYFAEELHHEDVAAHLSAIARTGKCYCLPFGWIEPEGRFTKREIGVEIPGVYDGGLFWQCPDCAGRWHRFEDERMRAKAEPYVSGGKEL